MKYKKGDAGLESWEVDAAGTGPEVEITLSAVSDVILREYVESNVTTQPLERGRGPLM